MVTNIGDVDLPMVIIRASVYLDDVENHGNGPGTEGIGLLEMDSILLTEFQ